MARCSVSATSGGVSLQQNRKGATEARRVAREKKRRAQMTGGRTAGRIKTRMALRGVVGNVTLSQSEVTVWYLLEPRSISFRPDREVEEMMNSGAAALAGFAGYRVYWRVTARPYAVREMAEASWNDAVTHTDGPLPGAAQMLEREQLHLRGADMSEKYVFMGVRVAKKRRYPSDPRREVLELRDRIEDVSSIMSKAGLEGIPATDDDMDLLLRRSVGLGLPAPRSHSALVGDLDVDDLPVLVSDVEVTAEPFARTCRVRGWTPTGEPIEKRVAILTMGRTNEMNVPQDGQGGWMHRTDRLPFYVEWMATIDVLPDERVGREVRHQLDIVMDQHKHYEVEHSKPAPEALRRQYAQAVEVESELDQGMGGLAARTNGWYRIAVWGDTEAEVRERVAAIKSLYGRKVEWWWSNGQYQLVREFIPCEPLANEAARRRMPVTSVLAALPAATAATGDDFGIVLGSTAGTSRRPVIWHPWHDMEVRHRSGLMMLSGGLGSGKSNALGLIIYRSAMLGTTWTVFDPSGRLAKLCELPELADYSEHINLMAGRDGELSPYRVISDPDPAHFQDRSKSRRQNEAELEEERESVRARRQTLCRDTLTSLLPRVLREDRAVGSVLGAAVRRVPAERTSSPVTVLEHLQAMANEDYSAVQGASEEQRDEWVRADRQLSQEHRVAARDVWDELEMFSRTPKGRLIFGRVNEADFTTDDRRVVLRVYSMHGLRIQSAQERASNDDKAESRQGNVLFNLAAWLTQQAIYLGDHNARKGLAIDEAHMLAFAEGQALMDKSSVDSRKHNARVILCSQNVNHFDIDGLSPLVGAVLVGRTTSDEAARDALKLMGLPPADGYVRLLGNLTRSSHRREREVLAGTAGRRAPHEFVFSTKDQGMTERIAIDGWAHPHVMDALNTGANSSRAVDDDETELPATSIEEVSDHDVA